MVDTDREGRAKWERCRVGEQKKNARECEKQKRIQFANCPFSGSIKGTLQEKTRMRYVVAHANQIFIGPHHVRQWPAFSKSVIDFALRRNTLWLQPRAQYH